jgi:hypothetical protein
MRAALLALLLTGCASTEATLLVGPRSNGEYTEIAANLSVVRKFSGRKVCAFIHESEVRNGRPFNGREEQTSDFVGCGLRFGGQ